MDSVRIRAIAEEAVREIVRRAGIVDGGESITVDREVTTEVIEGYIMAACSIGEEDADGGVGD